MKPSLPLRSFNAAIIPAHDAPPERENVLITQGVLNTITPGEEPAATSDYLVLIGGESKHYDWDSTKIVHQLHQEALRHPERHYLVTDSRRTPADFARLLGRDSPANIDFISHEDTPSGWVKTRMQQAAGITVTPDSVSMVYEALTSGRPVQLFDMATKKRNRIVRGIDLLLSRRWITLLGDETTHTAETQQPPLWEAERAANWLLLRFASTRTTRNGSIREDHGNG